MKAYTVEIVQPVNNNVKKFYFKSATVVNKMNLVEGFQPSQLQIVTNVTKRYISKGIENPIEIVLLGIHPRSQ